MVCQRSGVDPEGFPWYAGGQYGSRGFSRYAGGQDRSRRFSRYAGDQEGSRGYSMVCWRSGEIQRVFHGMLEVRIDPEGFHAMLEVRRDPEGIPWYAGGQERSRGYSMVCWRSGWIQRVLTVCWRSA